MNTKARGPEPAINISDNQVFCGNRSDHVMMNSKARGPKLAIDISDKLNNKITQIKKKTSSSTVSTEV